MVKRFSPLQWLFFFISLMLISQTQAATISAYVSRQDIRVDESFNLVFEAEGDVDDDPDFSPLSVYFDILNQSQSSNISIVNGSYSKKRVWTLSVMARQPGSYAIPPIDFGKDRSRAFTIKIHKASSKAARSDQSLFLEVEVDKLSGYVQSQFVYTVRLFRSVDISNATLTEPAFDNNDAIVEKLGEDKRYTTTRNGVRYAVVERRYAIFPQQSGQLQIKPLEFNGQIVARQRSFFDIAPFNGTSKRLFSKALDLDIKPVPATFKAKHWMPSTEVKLVDEWPENARFVVGEPVTRTLSLLAAGLTASQLPELSQSEIDGIKQYPDQPKLSNSTDDSGVIGIREEKIAYIPVRAGKIMLPEINIPWWNTKTGQLEYARVQAREITVAPGAQNTMAPPQPLTDQAQQTDSVSQPTNPASDQETTSFWLISSIVLLTGWLLTLVLYLRLRLSINKSKHIQTDKSGDNNSPPRKPRAINKKLASACNTGNAALCKTLLLQWAQQQWPESAPTTLGEIAARLNGTALGCAVEQLNQYLYAASSVNWQADQLLKAFEQASKQAQTSETRKDSLLQPLHKI